MTVSKPKATAKPKASPKEKGRFQTGALVRLKPPPTVLGYGTTYRPGNALVVRTEGADDHFEVTLIRWEDTAAHQLCWALDLELAPAETPKSAAPKVAAPKNTASL